MALSTFRLTAPCAMSDDLALAATSGIMEAASEEVVPKCLYLETSLRIPASEGMRGAWSVWSVSRSAAA